MKIKNASVQMIKKMDTVIFTDLDDTFLASSNAIERYAKTHDLEESKLKEVPSFNSPLYYHYLESNKNVKGGCQLGNGDILPFTLGKTLYLFTRLLEEQHYLKTAFERQGKSEKDNLFPFFKPIAVTARDLNEWNKAYDSGVNISNVAIINFGALLIETDKPLKIQRGLMKDDLSQNVKVSVNKEYQKAQDEHFAQIGYTRQKYYEDVYQTVKSVMENFEPDPYFQSIIQDLVGEFDFKQNFSLKIKTESINGKDYECYVKLNFTMPDSITKEALKHFEHCIRNRLGEENKGKIRQDIRIVKTKRGLVMQSSVDTKEYAVEYLIKAFKAINPKIITIGMGNAEVDLPFMNLTDISIKNNLFN